jgi:hypothetical protein
MVGCVCSCVTKYPLPVKLVKFFFYRGVAED